MLVDLTPIDTERIISENFLREECPNISEDDYWMYIMSYPQAHIETGIYHSGSGNLPKYLFEETSSNDFDYSCEYWNEFNESATWLLPNPYGVADNLEQIKEYFKRQISDPDEKYFIVVHHIYQEKENAYRGGGWRWHKNGPYIGNLEPQCEYLDDEDFGPDFPGYVIGFHCYKLK